MSPEQKSNPKGPDGEPALPASVGLPDAVQDKLAHQIAEFADLFEPHGERLANAAPGVGVRVENLENADEPYYLVPIFSGDEKPFFVAQVDVNTGELLRMEGIRTLTPQQEPWIYALRSTEILKEQIWRTNKEMPDAWESTGRLVWRYCAQSQSPMEPFHEVKSGGKIGYVDSSGNLHTELTLPGRKPPAPRRFK